MDLSMTLQISPYDVRWLLEFDVERTRLADALGTLARRIDHHGSTAVPGLEAKPIIDIQISVTSLEPLDAYAAPLTALGYVHVPHADDAVCPFFHRPAEWPHTHHVHVVRAGSWEERRTLVFRDYLCDHDAAARDYVALKKGLAACADADDPASREAYAAAKSQFIDGIVRKALAAGYPRQRAGGAGKAGRAGKGGR
jgi:GrpB-like predicted nucleotidyltransferase (UPF0157 family)